MKHKIEIHCINDITERLVSPYKDLPGIRVLSPEQTKNLVTYILNNDKNIKITVEYNTD